MGKVSSASRMKTCGGKNLCALCHSVLWIVCCLGSECLVAVSVNEPFIEGSDVPSVILSAFQSSLSYKQSSSLSSDVSHCSSSPVKTTDSTGASSVQHSSFRDCTADQHAVRSLDRPDSKTDAKTRKHWRPLLLVIPLRLGLSEINPIYYCSIKVSKWSW